MMNDTNDIIPPNDTIASSAGDTCSDTDNDKNQTKVTPTDITKQILSNSEGQMMMDHFMVTNSNEYDDYDDYPTDENTLGSLGKNEVNRLNLWQLAARVVKKEPIASTPKRSNISDEIPHINVINESHTVDDMDDGDSFLGNIDCSNVENSSTLDKDDTSFLESVAVQDAPTLKSVNGEVGDVESYYNIHASTLSRASASTKTSIGDQLLKESYMSFKMARNDNINLLADNQSSTTSKYSYKRAFENGVTLGGGSTYDCSALTEDYCYDAQRIGLGLPTERLDMTQVNYNEATEHSTPNRSADMIDEADPNHNEEHLTRVLSYGGEVEGYVDEEAARKYSPAQSRKGSSCCSWFTSSTRFAKLIVLCSLVLLFVSVASVSLALLMPEDEGEISSAETIASSSTLVNSTDEFDQEVDMTVVDNDPTNQMNSSNTISPSIKSVPSVKPSVSSTLTPSKSPQAVIYSTSGVIDSSTDAPVLSPSFKPSSKVPTPEPSKEPTTLGPSQTPTKSQIITNNPTLKPITSSPTTKMPTIQTLPETVTIQSRQETYLDSSESDENFGTSNRLRVDGSPRRWTLIEFDLSSINNSIQRQSRTVNLRVQEAKLRLYPTDSGGSSTVYAVPSSIQWSETSVTWNNFASVLASEEVEVGSIGWVNSYQWKEVDVSSAFTSSLTDISETITFVIKSRSTNGVSYRVGPFSPRLELTIGSDDVVTESPSPMPITTTEATPYPTYTPTVRLMRTAHPSPEPSRRTRAPHKRPLPTTFSPSGIPIVKSLPQENLLEESKFVPPGCSANKEDIDLVTKQAQLSEYGTHRMHVVFTETTDAIVLDSSDSNVLLEFNLGMIALASAIYSVVSVKLRLFVDSVDGDTTLSVLKYSNELDEGGNGDHTFQVTSSNVGQWVDLDVTDLIDHRQISKLVLTRNEETNGTFISGSGCHSSKLIIVTEI